MCVLIYLLVQDTGQAAIFIYLYMNFPFHFSNTRYAFICQIHTYVLVDDKEYIHISTYIHMYTYMYVCVNILISTHTRNTWISCQWKGIYECVCLCIGSFLVQCMCTHIHFYMHVYIVFVCVLVIWLHHVRIRIYIHTCTCTHIDTYKLWK